ncbi:DNA gyrase subunit A, partial [Staphylococcus agnetis]
IPIVNAIELDNDEKISTMIAVKDLDSEENFLVFATKKGLIKRSALSNFNRINKNGKIAINFRDDDELVAVRLTDGHKHILIGTSDASLIRFKESDVRAMSRIASGVRGIRLRDEDEVVGLGVADEDSEDEVLVVTEKGYGKRTSVSEYRVSNRGGMGVKTAKLTERNGQLISIGTVSGDEDIMVVTNHGVIIRMEVQDISKNGRMTQGVRLIKMADDQFVSTVAKVKREPEDIEDVEENINKDGMETQTEHVIDDQPTEDTIHTEVTETEDQQDNNDEREDLRQDFMDRVNEDIASTDDDEA